MAGFREKDEPVGRSKLEGVFTGAVGGGGAAAGGSLTGNNGESHGDGEDKMAEIRARALGLRHKALRRLMGSGEEERRTPHELFRQVCVYVFLSVIQLTPLHSTAKSVAIDHHLSLFTTK